MTTLTEFLLARIADDEAAAREAIAKESQTRTYFGGRTETLVDEGSWSVGPEGYAECRVEGTFMTIYDEGGHSREQAVHIARHDPARVLADCEAKRRIVELADEAESLDDTVWLDRGLSTDSGYDDPRCGERILRALALPYADHEAYREEWCPMT